MKGTWKIPKGTFGGTQASAGRGVGEQPDHEVEVVEEVNEDPELAHVQEALDALRGAGRLALFRKKPTWCAGFLTTIELQANEEIDLAQIKSDWGGGEIQFRPQRYTSNGVRFAPGGRTLRFTGPPRENGVEITPDGLGFRQQPGQPAVVLHERAAPVRPVADQTMPQLFAMLMDNMTRSNERVMSLLTAQLQNQRNPPAPADPLQQLSTSIRAFKQLDGLLGGTDEAEEVEAPQDVPPWLGKLIDKAIDKWDGKRSPQQQQQQQQPQPQQPGASWRLHKPPAQQQQPQQQQQQQQQQPHPQQQRPTARDVLAMFRTLEPHERMELLGIASGELDPNLIREWMSANGWGEEGEAVGG